MTLTLFASIAAVAFAVAFLHAALPTHWLPFVIVGRSRNWSAAKTLGVTAMAGVGHVAFTMVLGLGVVAAGALAEPRLDDRFYLVAGGLMVALGLFYILRHAHHARAAAPPRRQVSDGAAMMSLFVLLALSPCEAFLPFYLTGMEHGWAGFGILSLVLLLATGAGMMVFTGLSLLGARRLNLAALERYESAILGGALIVIGLAVAILET